MDTNRIVSEIKAEISRLQGALTYLEGSTSSHTSKAVQPSPSATTGHKKTAHKWTAAQKKAMSARLKAVWAEKKSSTAAKKKG